MKAKTVVIKPVSSRLRRGARVALLASLILASLVASGVAEAALQSCRTATFARPAPARDDAALAQTPANTMRCTVGVFVAMDEATRLWRCAATFEDDQDIPEDAPEHAFLLERRGHDLAAMPDTLMAGRLRSFDVITVDLDGDGSREYVLAAWNTQGNGIGINSWTIRVFTADWTLLRQFDEVLDWGDSNLVAAPKGRRGCDIAITSFVDSVNRKGVPGVSFEARFFALKAGTISPADDRPVLQRRYDRAFERQRTRLFERSEDRGEAETRGDLRRWLSHPATRRIKPDPR